jgi:hypothetical protein
MTPGAAGIALFGACSHPASPPARQPRTAEGADAVPEP